MYKNFPRNIVFTEESYTVPQIYELIKTYSERKFTPAERKTINQHLLRALQSGEDTGRWDRVESTKRKTAYPREAVAKVVQEDCCSWLRTKVGNMTERYVEALIQAEQKQRKHFEQGDEIEESPLHTDDDTLEDAISEGVLKMKFRILFSILDKYVWEFDEATLRADLAMDFLRQNVRDIEDMGLDCVEACERLKNERNYYELRPQFLKEFGI